MPRILVVHHDLTRIILFQNVLRRQGYQVVSACDYVTAVDIVQQTPIQLAFFSVWLSGISGVDLAHTLRTLDPTLPLVVLLSLFDLHRSRLDALNVTSILPPFDPDKIIWVTQLHVRSDVHVQV